MSLNRSWVLIHVIFEKYPRHEEEHRRREEEMLRQREQEEFRRQQEGGFKPNFMDNVSRTLTKVEMVNISL